MRALVLLALPALPACATTLRVPSVPSPPAVRPPPDDPGSHPGLVAGFGTADITPPPGPGLFGYGPEGKEAEGFRQRLQARTMLLEDARGERLALVVVELGAVPHHLQRQVASRLAERHPDALGVGEDRLFLAATHTHAGPANFMGGVFDQNASTVAGHDPALLEFLVAGIVASVEAAHQDRRPARIAWGRSLVWGLTRNRSLLPFEANAPGLAPPEPPPPSLSPSARAVDPVMRMLRVDHVGPDGVVRPRGLLTLFPIHGTGVPSANTLYDPDIHGRVARRVEAHLGEGGAGTAGAGVVHLFANTPSGDISPAVSPSTRCPVARKRTGVPALVAALAPSAGWAWSEPQASASEACLQAALLEVDALAGELAGEVLDLHGRLGPEAGENGGGITVARARHFLEAGKDGEGLCATPVVGAATAGGVADGITRLQGHLGIREGRVDAEGEGCQAPKVPFLGILQGLVASPDAFPGAAPFSVIRIGDVLLGTVPAEVTVTAGARMTEAMARGARSVGWEPAEVALLTLTGGYLYYTATREEYGLQYYEGSSTLYGPGQAETFAGILEGLAATTEPDGSSPPEDVPNLEVRLPSSRSLLPPSRMVHPGVPDPNLACDEAGRFTARWLDLDPGRRLPRPGPWVTVLRADTGEEVATDADPRVEIRLEEVHARGHWWSLRYLDTREGIPYRLMISGADGRVAPTSPVTLMCMEP